MLAELNRLDDRQLHHLLFNLERRVRSALEIGDAEITHDVLDEYLTANDEFDRRFSVWVVDRTVANRDVVDRKSVDRRAPERRVSERRHVALAVS